MISEAELVPASADPAVAVATWFVADYFTLDGSGLTRGSLERLLSDHVELPEADPAARSFVESVVPLSAEELDGGSVRVVALVRTLAASNGADYRRQPARARARPCPVTRELCGWVVGCGRPAWTNYRNSGAFSWGI